MAVASSLTAVMAWRCAGVSVVSFIVPRLPVGFVLARRRKPRRASTKPTGSRGTMNDTTLTPAQRHAMTAVSELATAMRDTATLRNYLEQSGIPVRGDLPH